MFQKIEEDPGERWTVVLGSWPPVMHDGMRCLVERNGDILVGRYQLDPMMLVVVLTEVTVLGSGDDWRCEYIIRLARL